MVRVKNRYIVTQIIPDKNSIFEKCSFNDAGITKCILKNVQKYYGELGLGSVEHGFRVKYCNDETKITIIRVRHRPHRFVISILPLITLINKYRAKFRIIYMGATIMQCNKFIVSYQKDHLNKMIGQIKSAKERMDFMKNVMDIATD